MSKVPDRVRLVDRLKRPLATWLATAGALLFGSSSFGQELVLAERLEKLQIDKSSFTLVDVRSAAAFERHHIPGAVNLPTDKLGTSELPKDRPLILYCGDAHCPLSHTAAQALTKKGHKNVGILYGGLASWEKDGHPVIPASVGKPKPQGDIAAEELQARRQATGTIVVVDVRTIQDFAAGHLPGALSIPLEEFADTIKVLDKASEIVVYDRLPKRSKVAVRQLAEAGLSARALSGGIGAWAMKGFPLEAGSQKGS